MKILIIKLRNIGDVLLTTPLFSNLKRQRPDLILHALVNEGTEEMLTENPHIDRILLYRRNRLRSSGWNKRLSGEFELLKTLRNERYDLAINLTNGERGLYLSKLAGIPKVYSQRIKSTPFLNRWIDETLPHLPWEHMVDIGLEPLRLFGLDPDEKRVELYWDQRVEAAIDHLFSVHKLHRNAFIHIHPVSRWMFKCIDDRSMAMLIDYCQEELSLPVVLTAAPIEKEKNKIASILQLCRSTPIDLSGTLTLKETAALNARSLCFVGVDTAIMHISAANDIPVLAFFGPSSAFQWGPWDNDLMQTGYHRLRGNQTMGRHRVLQRDWPCVPCNADGCRGSKISDCLLGWDPERLRNEIREMVSMARERHQIFSRKS